MGFNSVFKGLTMPTLLRYCEKDKIKEDRTGGVCGTHLKEEKCM